MYDWAMYDCNAHDGYGLALPLWGEHWPARARGLGATKSRFLASLETTVHFFVDFIFFSHGKRLREFALSKKMVSNLCLCNEVLCDEVVINTIARASILTKPRTNSVAVCGQVAAAEEVALHAAL
jgi:hypothetical protein